MSETATANPPSGFPWTALLRWQPFQIDALGLITLLGAEEVNAAVGRLVRNQWLEYFPLLGGFVIANEKFLEKEAGYSVYNISQGIHTTDLASWFSRWIKAQDFEQTRSFVRWTYEQRHDTPLERFGGITLSFLSLGFLIAMTVLSYDWYGFANALSMAGSVFVRHYMVSSLRESIDSQVQDRATRRARGSKPPQDGDEDVHPLEKGWFGNPSKVLIITADARAVTMLIPAELLRPPSPFIANLAPSKQRKLLFSLARWGGWVAFGVQIVTIGMADLATQLVTVFLLVVPTILHVSKLGCDDSQWGHSIRQTWRQVSGEELGVKSQKHYHDEEKKAPSNAKNGQFELKYVCWIGKYLKAEIYEWPPNHDYDFDIDAGRRGSGIYRPYPSHDRPQRRQHLYAWLQLDSQEVDSMDKWDLFPHKRGEGDRAWLNRYLAGAEYIRELSQKPGTQTITTLIRRAKGGAASKRGENPAQRTDVGAFLAKDDDDNEIRPSSALPSNSIVHRQETLDSITRPTSSMQPSSAMYVSQERARRESIAAGSVHEAVGINPGSASGNRDIPAEAGGGRGVPTTTTRRPPLGLDWLTMPHHGGEGKD